MIHLVYRPVPETDRWLPGDRWIRPLVRRVVRGPKIPGGIDQVFLNLCAGLEEIGAPFRANTPWRGIAADDQVGVLGRGRHCLAGYDRPNRILAGIGLMTHPAEWPTLFEDYPVALYLQHSEWTAQIYRRYYGQDRCAIWPVGIDTKRWTPSDAAAKRTDFLIYDKATSRNAAYAAELLAPIRAELQRANLSFEEIRYGAYRPEDYAAALRRCRNLLFLSEHESQGIACQEAMSCGLPVLAWDQGRWLDPNRFAWGTPEVAATSVPYFDERCGERFASAAEFRDKLGVFTERQRSGAYAPRDFVLEHLTLAKSATRYVELLQSIPLAHRG